ncbi:MAG: divalent-cation tolerance protein CutA [Sphingomonas sp.]|nr:divalent-cation tolerance protein CutA [Sphingomonas sp.]
MTEAVLIITSAGSREEADRIAAMLVEERLAACVQILPATSVYRWQGAIERAEELVLHIKTLAGCGEAVERRIREVHSYDVPEVIVLPITGGSADYLGWLAAEVGAMG